MSDVVSFIVRVSLADDGHPVAVVERVKTGRKERVDDLESIARVIAAALGPAAKPGAPLRESPPVGETP
jgi:hypothetical protein